MDETSTRLIKEACDNFQHVPYWFAQSATNVDDGGFAALYDSDMSPNGRFSNEIGIDLLYQVLREIGHEEFSARSGNIFNQDFMAGFDHAVPDDASDFDLSLAASKVAEATIEHVLKVFPKASEDGISDFRQPLEKFFARYMKSELDFAAPTASPALR